MALTAWGLEWLSLALSHPRGSSTTKAQLDSKHPKIPGWGFEQSQCGVQGLLPHAVLSPLTLWVAAIHLGKGERLTLTPTKE